ncbi:ABC transporter ATP-binding protein [Ruminiclostridium cellulolyticum]|uniref:ABC transporter related n=1 Tax=Ruminiclostridium cellulolyticum (strain ATCC 35319 / DSM 5812 / JCM 6584 / H10) TaxID=394503 RepID=B8I968_RUMCH|nr:ABC transporter ATP-binding protein [Ruminiclostridium cellulolyticum]ACL75328.1 ABC transporter related [Ruminiclostridium cellulolyticum H10]
MYVLEIKNLFKKVSDEFSLKDINLTIENGDFVSLIGKNGAGKTTLLRILSGLIKYDKGKVFIDGIPVEKSNKVNKVIGIVQQYKGMPDTLTVQEYIKFQARLKNADSKLLNDLIEISGLSKFSNQYLSTLSGGNLRKMHIMFSIMHKPKLVIMDEPTVGLDPVVRKEMWDYIYGLREIGISAIISTHYLDEAEQLGNKIAIIDNGNLLTSGTKEQVKELYTSEDGLDILTVDDENALEILKYIIELNLNFITKSEVMGNRVRVYTDSLDFSYLPTLVNLLSEHNFKIKTIKFLEPSIEELLMKISSFKTA